MLCCFAKKNGVSKLPESTYTSEVKRKQGKTKYVELGLLQIVLLEFLSISNVAPITLNIDLAKMIANKMKNFAFVQNNWYLCY